MPNYNYNRGRAREYQVMMTLKNSGWVCTRSAMSHGPVDIIAARRGRVRLIQVKSGSARVTSKELKLLKAWARAFNADAEIWSFRSRGQTITEIVLRRSGPKKKSVPKSLPIETVSEPEPSPAEISYAPQIETLRLIS